MSSSSSHTEFYHELKSLLPESLGAQRKAWAIQINKDDVEIETLSTLLMCDVKIAMKFAWLLTDVGEVNPTKLLRALPYLLEQSTSINHFNFNESFANYWLIAGIPTENEAQAIERLFQWAWSSETNVTIKARALKVLFQLTTKYPEITNELSLCLNDQLNKYSPNFEKKVHTILAQLTL